MVEVESSAETLVNYYQSTNYHTPEYFNRQLQTRHCRPDNNQLPESECSDCTNKTRGKAECNYDIIKQTMSQSFGERILIYLTRQNSTQ
jgi:hypothetical protein